MSFISRKICIYPKSSGPIWNSATLPISSNWSSISYSGGMFATVTQATSPSNSVVSINGITWASASGVSLKSITSDGSYFYGLGISGATYIGQPFPSSPTVLWLQANSLNSNYKNIAYGNGVLIAVDGNTTRAYGTIPDQFTIQWTQQSTAITVGDSLAYGNGRFISIRGQSSPSNAGAFTTNNGVSWTNLTLPLTQSWQSIAYGNGVFVIVASGSATGLYSTNNGSSWSSFTIPGGAANWNSVAYGGGMFMAVAGNSTRSAYSYDGINWTALTIPGASATWKLITYGNNRFAAIASNSNAVAYTT